MPQPANASAASSSSESGSAGRVLLNGARAKPSHALAVGDRLALEGRAGALEVLELPRAGLSREAARARLREIERGG